VITRFLDDAHRVLHVGDVIHVTLEGTPGGRASFQILGIEPPVPLPEIARGRYAAALVLPAGLNVFGAPLVGTLRMGGQAALPVESADTLTLDSLPPRVTIYGPDPGEKIYNRLPDLAVEFSDQGAGVAWDRCKVAMWAHGAAVPLTLTRHGRELVLDFPPLPPGPVEVVADCWDRAGNHVAAKLEFTVRGEDLPEGQLWVSHDAAGRVLLPGATVQITVFGPPHCVASFSLGNWRENLPLKELPNLPGAYRGAFVVPAITEGLKLTISAQAAGPGGRIWTGTGRIPVIFAAPRPLLPRLVAPVAGQRAGSETIIEGFTEPLAEVTCQISWRANLPANLVLSGRVTRLTLLADADGHFKSGPIRLSTPFDAPVDYILTATATEGTHESPAVTVLFKK
jgi:hypothetical protein